MKQNQEPADIRKKDRGKGAAQAPMSAPWPDQKARQQMSQSELACEDGKHDKNADWKKTW